VGVVGDNTAAAVSFYKPLHDHVFKNEKLNLVVDEVYTPPLTDATTLVQGVRSARPDFMLIQSTNVPDDKLLVDKFAEYNMTASKLPMVGGGGHWCVPELLKVAGADNLEGVLVGLANWPGKAVADVAQRFIERTKEPWFGHDSIFAYVHVLILKEALERAGVAEMLKELCVGLAACFARRSLRGTNGRKDFGVGSSGFQERPIGSIGDESESARLDIERDIFRKDVASNQRQEFSFAERTRTAKSDPLRTENYPDEADKEGNGFLPLHATSSLR